MRGLAGLEPFRKEILLERTFEKRERATEKATGNEASTVSRRCRRQGSPLVTVGVSGAPLGSPKVAARRRGDNAVFTKSCRQSLPALAARRHF